MEKIKIRKATIEDAEFISLLARVTFTETFGHYFRDHRDLTDYYDRIFCVSKIRSGLLNDNNMFWIALCDELPVGYAKLKKRSKSEFIDSNDVSQLQKIYVLNDFQSMRIGENLQSALFEETISSGSKFLWLSVLKTNIKAISFYRKHGFYEIGEHTFDIGKEHFVFTVMNKNLD